MFDKLNQIRLALNAESAKLNIVVDDAVRAAVSEYRDKNVIARFFHRLIRDKEILAKARAIAYLELSNVLDGLETTLPTKITNVKALCCTNPDDVKSPLPQYDMQRLLVLPKELKENIKQVQDYTVSTQTTLCTKIQAISELCDVMFCKGQGSNGFLKKLGSDIKQALLPITTALGNLAQTLLAKILCDRAKRAMMAPEVLRTQQQIKKLEVVNADSPEKIVQAAQKATEIESLLVKLSLEEIDAFLEKYPQYEEARVTMSVFKNPVIWKLDDKTYERSILEEHLKKQVEQSTDGRIRDLNNKEHNVLPKINRTLVANTALQDKILADLKVFYENNVRLAGKLADLTDSADFSVPTVCRA